MKTKAFIYIILAGVLWGTSGIFVGFLAPYGFTSLQMTSVRATVSFIFMLAYVLITDRSLFRVKPLHLLLFAGAGVSLFLTASLYYHAMQMTSVSTAVMLLYMSPIYITAYSCLFLGEKLTRTKVIAIAAMLVGCALVSGVIGGLRFDAVGMLLGVLSGFTYTAYNVLIKISLQRGTRPVSVTVYSFAIMALISVFVIEPISFFESVSKNPSLTVPLLIGLGICTFIIPYFLYALAMRDLSAGTASALSIVEPMSATLFSVMIFDEKLDPLAIVGIVIILAAIFVIGKSESCDAGEEVEVDDENVKATEKSTSRQG